MQELLEVITLAYKKLSTQNIVLLLLLIKIFFCAAGGLIVTYTHSKFSYKWLRNNFNLYVGITLPIIGLVITTVIGSNIALSIGMIGAFDAIAAANNISPGIVASGIGVALITTVSGLLVAMVLQVFYNYIVAKVDSIVNEMEDASISLIDIMIKHNMTK